MTRPSLPSGRCSPPTGPNLPDERYASPSGVLDGLGGCLEDGVGANVTRPCRCRMAGRAPHKPPKRGVVISRCIGPDELVRLPGRRPGRFSGCLDDDGAGVRREGVC